MIRIPKFHNGNHLFFKSGKFLQAIFLYRQIARPIKATAIIEIARKSPETSLKVEPFSRITDHRMK
jgi:hypothetical protein